MSIHDFPSPPERATSYGFGLIELIVFILVVGIGATGILSVMNSTTAHSADPLIRIQALRLAESMLEEISAYPFTWCDPDDPALLTASAASGCATPESLGPESGETRYGPTFFDNVNDYNGFSMNGVIGIDGVAVTGLEAYAISVTVSAAGTPFGIPADAALAVLVRVNGRGETVSMTGYRFRYAPNSGG